MCSTELGAKTTIKNGCEIVKEWLKKDLREVMIHLIIQSIFWFTWNFNFVLCVCSITLLCFVSWSILLEDFSAHMICIETGIHKQKIWNKVLHLLFLHTVKSRFLELPRKTNIGLKIVVQLRERNRLLVRVCKRFKNLGFCLILFKCMEERLH